MSNTRLILIAACFALTACGSKDNVLSKEVDYKSSQNLPPLEAPPGLIVPTSSDAVTVPSTGTMTLSEYANAKVVPEQQGGEVLVLPEVDGIRLERAGNTSWLVFRASPTKVWSKVQDFWLKNGFKLKRSDPVNGIMETEWAENRADIPKGYIRGLIEKITKSLYSAATRDKFRVRLERGIARNTTELYLTHRGVEEIDRGGSFIWQQRPSDPDLEAEMLRRIMTFFGVKASKVQQSLAKKKPTLSGRTHLVMDKNGKPTALLVRGDFLKVWRQAGLALDRAGFVVEVRNPARGIYLVHPVDAIEEMEEVGEESWFSWLKFWDDEEEEVSQETDYQIRFSKAVDDAGTAVTRVLVSDKTGKRKQGRIPERILELLHEQLR